MKKEGISALLFRKWCCQLLDKGADGRLSRAPNPNKALHGKRKQGKEPNEVQGVLPAEATSDRARILVRHSSISFEN